MQFRYTKHYLKKLEELMGELRYTVRYEKGNFNSGYCIVQDSKVAVVNKFYDTDGRINVLLEILAELDPNPEQLSESARKLLKAIHKQQRAAKDEEE